MAKWTIGILDAQGWGVGGATAVCGAGLSSSSQSHATINQHWSTWVEQNSN